MEKANERIRYLRTELDVSQEEVAKYLGMSRITYFSIETWKRELKFNEAKKLANFYEVSLSYILWDSDISNKSDDNYKLKQLILYITKETEGIDTFWKTVLNKLLYFSDFDYYEWTNRLITWSNYIKLPRWPAVDNLTEVLEEMQRDSLIDLCEKSFSSYIQFKITPRKEADLDFLNELDESIKSEYENIDIPKSIEIINNVLNRFKYHKASAISSISHRDAPYYCTNNIGETINPDLVYNRNEEFRVKSNI